MLQAEKRQVSRRDPLLEQVGERPEIAPPWKRHVCSRAGIIPLLAILQLLLPIDLEHEIRTARIAGIGPGRAGIGLVGAVGLASPALGLDVHGMQEPVGVRQAFLPR